MRLSNSLLDAQLYGSYIAAAQNRQRRQHCFRSMSRAWGCWAIGAEQKCTTREVIGQRKCPRQLFERSVTEAGWQQAGRVSEDGFWHDLWVV